MPVIKDSTPLCAMGSIVGYYGVWYIYSRAEDINESDKYIERTLQLAQQPVSITTTEVWVTSLQSGPTARQQFWYRDANRGHVIGRLERCSCNCSPSWQYVTGPCRPIVDQSIRPIGRSLIDWRSCWSIDGWSTRHWMNIIDRSSRSMAIPA